MAENHLGYIRDISSKGKKQSPMANGGHGSVGEAINDEDDVANLDEKLERFQRKAQTLNGVESEQSPIANCAGFHFTTDQTLIGNDPQTSNSGSNSIRRNGASQGTRYHSVSESERPTLRVQFDRDTDNESSTRKSATEDLLNGTSSRCSVDSSNESSSSEDIRISEAKPPDGGWGWVIVVASFFVNMIADGITFSFGVIFVELVNYFEENNGNTAIVGGLFMAMPLLSGPIASFLTDRFGCRRVTIFGSLLASLAFVISSRVNSMQMLYLTFGLMAGFGLSLCYVASVVIVAFYFEKKRSFATGLAVCGSGIGTFIFAPLIQKLLEEYGWRGTTLILAGLFLNLAVCGALMRDLPWTAENQKRLADKRKHNRKTKKKIKTSVDTFSVSTNTASVLQPILEAEVDQQEEQPDTDPRLCSSLVNLPTFVKNGEKVPIEVIELLATHKHLYNMLMTNYPDLLTTSRSFSDSGRLNERAAKLPDNGHAMNASPSNRREEAAYLAWLKKSKISPPKCNPVQQRFYLRHLRVHRLSVTYRGAMLNINRYKLRASSCPDVYRNSMTTIASHGEKVRSGIGNALHDLWELLIDMFDFSYFQDPKFLLFALSNFLLYTWYDVPYVYLSDNAIRLGYSENQGSLLISAIGIVNMVGEIILGWMGDRPWANAGLIYAISMACCGAVCSLVPLVTDYSLLCVLSGSFGFFIAANYSLTCIILVELISLERFTNAYGLLLLVQGFGNLIGPPIGGYISDYTKNYNLSFYLAGIFIALSGALLLILPMFKRYKKYVSRQVSTASINVEHSIHQDHTFMTHKGTICDQV